MSRLNRISPPAPASRHIGEAGFTIIEVLVAALIVAIVSAGGAVAFGAAIGTSGIQRHRSAAEALAQRNQARLTGDTVGQLSNLNQTLSPVTLDGTQYTIQESATFVSDSSGSASCSNPSADYLQTSSSVTWTGMPSALAPVKVSGVITPTFGEISSSAGVLAVQVQDPSLKPLAGLPVSVSGPSSASGVTAANGCVLFGDLPVGNYSVSVTPASGAYVDASSGQVVNSSSPDTQTNAAVTSGTTASSAATFTLAVPGAATFAFTTAWPTGVAPSPAPIATSPSVILASSSLTTNPSYIVCSNQDTAGCPAVGNPDTNWGASAWSSASGGTLAAQPLAPYTYTTYAGICTSDDPAISTNGGVMDASTAVTSQGNTATSLRLSAAVVRLYSGTGTAGAVPVQPAAGAEMALPSGSKLVITDTGCGEHYVGGPGVSAVPSGDSALPYTTGPVINGGVNDIGLLTYPGMPDGSYTACYQNGSKDAQVSFTNKGSGEVINLYNASLATGSCAT